MRDKQLRRGSILEVRVHPDDLGKVIGRGGRTATAFRTVISALAGRGGARIDFVDVDRAAESTQRTLSGCRPSRRHPFAFRQERTVSAIEVVVGRIGKPHGLRGEVTVDVRTDEPERRFAAGAVLRAEPPAGLGVAAARADRRPAPRWHQAVLLVTFEELADRNAAEAARGIVLHADDRRRRVARGPRRVLRPPAGRARGVRRRRHARSARSPALVHGGAQDLLRIRTPDGREALVPFVKALVPEVDVAGGRVVVADRPGLVTPLPDDDGGRPMRLDYLTIFPDYLAPLRAVAARQGRATRACSSCTSTTCATGPTTGTAPSTTRRTAAEPAW